jgi:glycine/D-amino acid oxidase-like deaminating enzyme
LFYSVYSQFSQVGEGWLDPYSLLIAFRKKSVSLGARFIESEVVGIETSPNGANKNPHISRLILSRGDAIEVSRDTLVLNTSGMQLSFFISFHS